MSTERIVDRLNNLIRTADSIRIVIEQAQNGTPPGRECARSVLESAYALSMELVALDAVMVQRKATRLENDQ